MRSFLAGFLSILTALLGLTQAVPVEPGPVCFIGHRGYSACYLDNTDEAFRMAGEAGFGGVETDVRMTLDGVLVLSHDEAVHFADGKDMKVSTHTLSQLRSKPLKNEFTDSELYLCTFEEYLNICKEYGMFCFIEIKGYIPVSKIIEAFRLVDRCYDLDRCEFQSFELPVLLAAHAAFPNLRIMLTTNSFNFNAKAALALGFDIDIRHDALTEEVVQTFHEKGLRVSTFTVNDADEVARCAALGVDYIESDMFSAVPV